MSKPRAASKPARPHRKPRADIYTALLALALVALIIGIVCLYFELDIYGFKRDAAPHVMAQPVSTMTATGALAHVTIPTANDKTFTTPPPCVGC